MKKADFIIILCFLIAGGVIASVQMINRKPGKKVMVTVEGRKYKVLKLDNQQQIKIECKDGHYNVLRIKDGKASVIEADCKNQKCVQSHSIQNIGESISCLPHKVIVKIIAN